MSRESKERSLHVLEKFASQLSEHRHEGGEAYPCADNDNMQVDTFRLAARLVPEGFILSTRFWNDRRRRNEIKPALKARDSASRRDREWRDGCNDTD